MAFAMRQIGRMITLLAIRQDLKNPVSVECPLGQDPDQQEMDLRWFRVLFFGRLPASRRGERTLNGV